MTKVADSSIIIDPAEVSQLKVSIDQLIHEITSYHDQQQLIMDTKHDCERVISELKNSIVESEKASEAEACTKTTLEKELVHLNEKLAPFDAKHASEISQLKQELQSLQSKEGTMKRELDGQK